MIATLIIITALIEATLVETALIRVVLLSIYSLDRPNTGIVGIVCPSGVISIQAKVCVVATLNGKLVGASRLQKEVFPLIPIRSKLDHCRVINLTT